MRKKERIGGSANCHCSCNEGYFGLGNKWVPCTLKDRCADKGLNDCHKDAICTNVAAEFDSVTGGRGINPDGTQFGGKGSLTGKAAGDTGYTCKCKSGFHGDGKHCDPIDMCKPNPTSGARQDDCGENSECKSTGPGAFECVCKDGMTDKTVGGTGKKCCPDGVHSSWTEWSACSKSCGPGIQTRTRTIEFPHLPSCMLDAAIPASEKEQCRNCHEQGGIWKTETLVNKEGKDVIMVIDNSGSMSGSRIKSAVQEALRIYDDHTTSEDSIGLMVFSSRYSGGFKWIFPLQRKNSNMRDQIKTADYARGGTPLYSSLIEATRVTPAHKRSYLVALADGGNSGSKPSLSSALAAIKSSDWIPLIIGLEVSSSLKSTCEKLASAHPSGKYKDAPDHHAALKNAFKEVATEMTRSICSMSVPSPGAASQAPVCKGSMPSGPLKEERHCQVACCKQDGQAGPWGGWSSCSKSCGGGTRSRTRDVIWPNPDCKGKDPLSQPADREESEACNTDACPVHCQATKWSEWSSCSASCGGGTRTRTRTIIQKAEHGGNQCHGGEATTQTEACNEGCCPKDVEMSKWSSYGACSEECGGGLQSKTRKVIQWATCGGSNDGAYDTVKTRECNTHSCFCTDTGMPQSEKSQCLTCHGGGGIWKTKTTLKTEGKDIMLVIDQSGSMRGKRINAAIDEALNIFDYHTSSNDRLGLLTFRGQTARFNFNMNPRNPNMRKAIKKAKYAKGWTPFYRAVIKGAGTKSFHKRAYMVILVDGDDAGQWNGPTLQDAKNAVAKSDFIPMIIGLQVSSQNKKKCQQIAASHPKGQYLDAPNHHSALQNAFKAITTEMEVSFCDK